VTPVPAPQISPPPAEEPVPPPTPQALFQAVCGSCHTLAAAGTTSTTGPNLDEERRSADEVAEVIRTGNGPMPSFAGNLTEQQIAEIAAYVASAAGSSGGGSN
jgi:mono/diheme cytochrome c family protein